MKRFFLYGMILCLAASGVRAQGVMSVWQREQVGRNHLWMSTDNAAALSVAPLPSYGSAGLHATQQEGLFRPVREASSSTRVGADATGSASVGKMQLWGTFSFLNVFDRGRNFNASRYEPSDDMPYFILDPNPSAWTGQEYDMQVKAALPLSSLWAAGAAVRYTDKVGAKQKDPRCETYVMDVEVMPSLVRSGTSGHRFGLSGYFRYSYERAYPSNNNYRQDQQVVTTLGLGEGIYAIVGGNNGLKEFYYTDLSYGGALQYAWKGGWEWLAELKGKGLQVEVEHQKSLPQSKGKTKGFRVDGQVSALWGEDRSDKLSVSGFFRYLDGIEKVQQRDNTAFNQQWVTIAENKMSRYQRLHVEAAYDHCFPDGRWSVGGTLAFDRTDDRYLIPESRYDWSRLVAQAYAVRRFQSGKNDFRIEAACGFGKGLGGGYVYGGSKTESPALDQYRGDLAYYRSDFALVRSDLSWSRTQGRLGWQWTAFVDYRSAIGAGEWMDRLEAGLSFSLLF